MSKRSAVIHLVCFAASLATAPLARAADVKIEQLELLTHGGLDESTGSFKIGSRIFFDMALEGGDKFAGLLRLSFLNGDVEEALSLAERDVEGQALTEAQQAAWLDSLTTKLNNITSPRFKTASVTARAVFGLPLDLSYFIGYLDSFASGDDFVQLFGAAPFASEMRGPMVYPEGIGGNPDLFYQGIHAVNGTGFRLSTTPRLSSSQMGMVYLYQDSDLGAGSWSVDLRGFINKEKVKFEAFAGTSTAGSGLIFRGGILFYAFSGDVGEFFAQVGVPRWDPADGFSLQNLYYLFEPRINFGPGSIAITLFSHPAWYRQIETDANSRFDLAFNFRFGTLSQDGAQGGIQALMALKPLDTPPASADIAPYYSVIAGGIQWDFKLDLRVFPFPSEWYGIFRPFIGLKTSF
ncbi:MAG: hypothetical protein Q8M76_04900 [Spirochaetaceae bacterium]|nr:hypothetical protein [Spirochaetaceae bacterium]